MNRGKKRKLKDLRRQCTRPFETLAIYSLLHFVKCFTLKGARRFSSVLGAVFIMVPSVKKLVMANLDVAFPDKSVKEKKRIARLSQTNLIMVFVELLWYYGREKDVLEHVSLDEESLNNFKKMNNQSGESKPLILLTMHLGNWEVNSHGYGLISDKKMVCVARKIKNEALEHIMYSARTALGVDIAHQEGAVRALMKNLKTKQTVGLVVDQNTKLKEGGVYGDFFGLPATITKSPATLARKFNADICFIRTHRTDQGFKVYLTPLEESVDDFASDADFSGLLLQKMQGFIEQDPALWTWFYKRWDSWPKSHEHLAEKYPYYAKEDRQS